MCIIINISVVRLRAWDFYEVTKLRVQDRDKHAARSSNDHISPKLRELNWLPVKEHLLFRDTVLMYKCINNLAPHYLCNKFSKRSNIHEYNTRTRELLQIPMYNTTTGQRTFHYRGAKL